MLLDATVLKKQLKCSRRLCSNFLCTLVSSINWLPPYYIRCNINWQIALKGWQSETVVCIDSIKVQQLFAWRQASPHSHCCLVQFWAAAAPYSYWPPLSCKINSDLLLNLAAWESQQVRPKCILSEPPPVLTQLLAIVRRHQPLIHRCIRHGKDRLVSGFIFCHRIWRCTRIVFNITLLKIFQSDLIWPKVTPSTDQE